MISKALETFAEDIGLKIESDCAYGDYKGYMITLSEKGNKRNVFINYYLMDSESDALKKFRLSESVKSDMSTFGIKEFDIDDNGLSVELIDTISKLAEYLDILIEKLNDEDIVGHSNCSECGKHNSSDNKYKTVSLNQNRYVLCDSCTLNLIQNSSKMEAEKKAEDTSGSLGLGILGSIIGLLVGTAIWGFIASFGIVTMWMGFALALLIYIGYVLFKGKKGKTRVIVISAVSLVGVIINSMSSEVIKVFKLTETVLDKFLISPVSHIQVAMEHEKYDFTITFIIALLCAAFAIIVFATDILKDKPKPETIKID